MSGDYKKSDEFICFFISLITVGLTYKKPTFGWIDAHIIKLSRPR